MILPHGKSGEPPSLPAYSIIPSGANQHACRASPLPVNYTVILAPSHPTAVSRPIGSNTSHQTLSATDEESLSASVRLSTWLCSCVRVCDELEDGSNSYPSPTRRLFSSNQTDFLPFPVRCLPLLLPLT